MAGLAVGSICQGQVVWSDGFEDYASGSGLSGQGGWSTWDDDPTFDSVVTNAIARTGSNAIDIKTDSDTIYVFHHNGLVIDCGQWRVTAWVYTPSDMNAPNDTFFLLLNEYEHGGPQQWSTSIHFSTGTGTVYGDWDNESLPLITDEWVEMRVDIDLENDTQDVYYGGALLYTDAWTNRIAEGGLLQLQCMDLFAYGATSNYFDDITLEQIGSCPPECATLDVVGNNAGSNVRFDVTGGEAGQRYGIFYSPNPDNLAGFNDCMASCGNSLGCARSCLGKDFANQVSVGKLDGNGEASYSTKVPCSVGGKTIYFMVATFNADGTICGSEVVEVTFNPC
ncbi:MAG: hypothetical protein D8M59_10330 [Planctomycetes bacterium]|nr:hypothetical protein [Planctomycetota bacterium]